MLYVFWLLSHYVSLPLSVVHHRHRKSMIITTHQRSIYWVSKNSSIVGKSKDGEDLRIEDRKKEERENIRPEKRNEESIEVGDSERSAIEDRENLKKTEKI